VDRARAFAKQLSSYGIFITGFTATLHGASVTKVALVVGVERRRDVE
jgi:hypothetical protein